MKFSLFPVAIPCALVIMSRWCIAQTPPSDYQKVKSTSPESTAVIGFFSLSTFPEASDQKGSPGRSAGLLHWDGKKVQFDMNTIDPETGEPLKVPLYTVLSPEEKPNTVVITATIKLPAAITPPTQISVKAQRIRKTAGVAPSITTVGDPGMISLPMVVDSFNGKPQPDGIGNITYTYRTHDLGDLEILPRRITGAADWKVTDKRGRWRLEVADYPSNSVEFKIDKRTQIVNTAEDWANYVWNYHPEWGVAHPNGLWSKCQPFVAHIYGRHGLQISAAAGESETQLNEATADDDGPAALRFYWTFNSGKATPAHTAIIGRNNTRIDTNGPYKRTYTGADGTVNLRGYNGPSMVDSNYGITNYFGDFPDFEGSNAGAKRPRSRSLPGEVKILGVIDPTRSLLKELDEE